MATSLPARDWTLEAVHAPGHMSNHHCFLAEEKNLLFFGGSRNGLEHNHRVTTRRQYAGIHGQPAGVSHATRISTCLVMALKLTTPNRSSGPI